MDKEHSKEIKLISKNENELLCAVRIFEAYSKIVPLKDRLWFRFDKRARKYVKSVVGKNTLTKIASKVAKSFGKNNWKGYTGHSFRVSSATALGDADISTINLKRHEGWKS